MRKTRLLFASACILAGVVTIAPAQAFACYCQAASPFAYGWGTSSSCSRATRTALRQCAIRTPRGYWCYLSFCT